MIQQAILIKPPLANKWAWAHFQIEVPAMKHNEVKYCISLGNIL